MPNIGLRGLPGLNKLSDEERRSFLSANADKLKKYSDDPEAYNKAAEILYNNKAFKNVFGEDSLKEAKAAGYSYEQRNNMLKEKIVNDAFTNAYKPKEVNGRVDLNTGAGKEWEKIQGLSTDAKQELLESDWKTPEQMKKYNSEETWLGKAANKMIEGNIAGKAAGLLAKGVNDTYKEARNQYRTESNQKILDRIYNNDADTDAAQQGTNVSQAYGIPEITGTSDEDTKKKFYEAITPSKTNMGIPEYASRWGDGTDPSSEMEDFSIDDMRQILAKKYVYDRTMSPDKAFTALNNEAKRYIKQHQGSLKRFGLFAKDVGISAMSYTADKINGIYNLALATEDALGEKPTVFVDDSGNILDPKKTSIIQDGNGNLFYDTKDGQRHSVHREQIDRRTLHNMGKNFDGSDADEGIFHLNPQYWTRAEQFGTLDSDEQKQYEKLKSSPHKVAYNPNDESDLVYESFKMMSFGLADAASMFIPFGVGVGGRVLSTASKVGKLGRGMGKAMETTGKYLSAQSKVGQVAQGIAGAGGIAYAYQRGAFQETLAQNLANAEEANLNRSKQEIYDLYNNDAQYKAQVDVEILNRARELKQQYMASGNEQMPSDDEIMAQASNIVNQELVAKRAQENKGTQAYADLQQEAIQSAGDAAWTSFWPEAIKYGLVNTVGYRKFLYTNPSGLKKPISRAMKGMKEMKTADGLRRLGVEATDASNLKKLGKVVGSQFWGGAWTNGTDDMMVDAAERINKDSFDRYLNAYENGEALADEYGLIDGLYSYWKGLGNSLGQETTWNAAAVGGFGSLVSASPNMANIAHLATKEGREAFKDNYQKRLVYETDEKGFKKLKRDENGNPVTEDVSWKENLGERASFFIQNGVLNNYYGAKQNERDLQNHADYVNSILDRYEDFSALKNLIASDIERQNAETIGDEKTMRFVHAFDAINALNQLSKDKNDALKFSSVVDEARTIIDGASKIGTEDNPMSEEQMADLIKEYYSHNPGVEESDTNHEIALSHIAQNAQKMMEAYKAFNEADEHISNYEKDKKISIVPAVRSKMLLSKALSGHWKDRLKTMQDEIGDTSDMSVEPTGEDLIATYGGVKNANTRLKQYENGRYYVVSDGGVVFDPGEKQLIVRVNSAKADESRKLDKYNQAQQKLREAETSEDKYNAEQEVNKAIVEYEDAIETRSVFEDRLSTLQEKKKRLQEAIDAHQAGQSKVLSADEIMALDPITRARMFDFNERAGFNKAQSNEINKLIGQLKDRDSKGDPVQKIQDIAVLTQRIAQANDAYNRMSRNPDAAALQLEKQTAQEAEKAYNLINERNAQTLANTIQEIEDGLKVNKVKKSDIDELTYRMLRKHSNTLLDIIDYQGLLPQYQTQIDKAKEWSGVLTDIDAVVSSMDNNAEQKKDLGLRIDNIIDSATSKKEIIDNLEKAIDDPDTLPEVAQEYEKVLTNLAQLGYQRDATVIENRKQRLEREENDRKKKEAEQKAAEEAAKKAAEEAAKALQESSERGDDVMSKDNADMGEEFSLGDEEETAKEASSEKPAPAITPALLMDKDAEDGIINSKEMWGEGNNPQKGIFSVKKENGNISFATDDKADTLEITPDEYTIPQETKDKLADKEIPQNSPFIVKSIENKDDGWYFNGNFAEDNETVSVKATDKFDINKAIDRQRQQREEAAMALGVDTGNPNIIDDGEQLSANSTSIEPQVQGDTNIVELNTTDEVEEANKQGEQSIQDNPNVLSGTAMEEYDSDALTEHKLVRKVGKDPNDSMNHFYAWLENQVSPVGPIKLQNIIDTELPLIYKKNPNAKIKFMSVKPEETGTKVGDTKATKDNNINRYIFLVVDYTDDVKRIHNESNGGVIKAAGKKYLIVGTVGYGNVNHANERKRQINQLKQEKFNTILRIKDSKDGTTIRNNEYYRKNPLETFRVLDDVYTEIVPYSMIPGYMIKYDEGQKNRIVRPISEILKADNEKYGTSLTLQDLKWGIQEYSKFLPIKEDIKNVMKVRRVEENAGAAFVLIPAGNGKYLPVHIDARRYSELREGSLTDRLENEIFTESALFAPGRDNYLAREKALEKLLQIFYLKKGNNNIFIGKNDTKFENRISLVNKDGEIIYSAVLDNTFDRDAFLDAFRNRFDPRVNITYSALMDTQRLIELDEAGALDTDVATLHTAGISYSIYAVDETGKMIKPETVKNTASVPSQKSNFSTDNAQVWYSGVSYSYNAKDNSYQYNGGTVTEDANPTLFKSLEFNREISLGKRTPNYSDNGYKYYVMKDGENPLVIKEDVHHVLSELSEKESKKIVDDIKEEKLRKERAKNAEATIEERKKSIDTQDIGLDIGEDAGELIMDEQTGMVGQKPVEQQETQAQQKEGQEVSKPKKETESSAAESKLIEGASKPSNSADTQSFEALIKKKKYKNDIYNRLAKKFLELGIDIEKAKVPSNEELRKFLEDKGMVLDGIGTSDDAIKAWMDTIEKCR